ncbi:YadA family autotransporter adhesin, partial [Achromobacter xylosoxidans]
DNVSNLTTQVSRTATTVNNLTTQMNNGEVGLVRQDAATNAVTVAGTTGGSSVNMAGAEGARTVSGVNAGALAATSTDAVNGSQLFATNATLADQATALNTIADLHVQHSERVNTLTQTLQQVATIQQDQARDTSAVVTDAGSGGSRPTVAQGTQGVAMGSGSGVAGAGGVALGKDAQANATGSVALGAGSVADRANTVSVGSAGQERQITNVAAGTAPTDAANLGQVQDISRQSSGQAVQQANAYTDSKIGQLRSEVNAGVASAMAMAGLPSASIPGKGMLSMAASTYEGRSAMAIGVSGMSGNGTWVYKASGSTTTRGRVGATAGVGFHW